MKAPHTNRNGLLTPTCGFCKKKGGRHRLGCPGFTFEHDKARDGGDELPVTIQQ